MLNGVPACKDITPDLEEFDVHWQGNGRDGRLAFNIGCETDGSGEIWKILATAPALLGLADLPALSRPILPER